MYDVVYNSLNFIIDVTKYSAEIAQFDYYHNFIIDRLLHL